MKFITSFLLTLISTGLLFAQPTVSVQWLKKHLGTDNVILLDISTGEDFAKGHITGAVNNFTMKSINEKKGKILYEVSDKSKVQTVLRGLGINDDSHVIIIWPADEMKHVYFGTRTFFVLKNYGVNVSLLDGGMKAWNDAGYSVTQEVSEVKEGNITLKNFNTKEVAMIATVKDSKLLIDSRPASFYKGEKKKKFVAKAGTITGAISLPFMAYLNDDWTFKSPEAIKAVLATNKAGKNAIYFCNTGNLASIGWFVSEYFANYDAQLYDGSMNEWAGCEDCPVQATVAN